VANSVEGAGSGSAKEATELPQQPLATVVVPTNRWALPWLEAPLLAWLPNATASLMNLQSTKEQMPMAAMKLHL
jgi:hypothetical protein